MSAYAPPLTNDQFVRLQQACIHVVSGPPPLLTPQWCCALCHQVAPKILDVEHKPHCALAVVSTWLSSPDVEERALERVLDGDHGDAWKAGRMSTATLAAFLTIGIKTFRDGAFLRGLYEIRTALGWSDKHRLDQLARGVDDLRRERDRAHKVLRDIQHLVSDAAKRGKTGDGLDDVMVLATTLATILAITIPIDDELQQERR